MHTGSMLLRVEFESVRKISALSSWLVFDFGPNMLPTLSGYTKRYGARPVQAVEVDFALLYSPFKMLHFLTFIFFKTLFLNAHVSSWWARVAGGALAGTGRRRESRLGNAGGHGLQGHTF